MNMYKPHREESDEVIRMLATSYPKTFFLTPPQRRPLKNSIVADLQKDGFGVATVLLQAGVEWYKSHLGYLHSLQVGAKRLDLKGKEVGTVTREESLAAFKKIKAINAEKNRIAAEASSAARYPAAYADQKAATKAAAEKLFHAPEKVNEVPPKKPEPITVHVTQTPPKPPTTVHVTQIETPPKPPVTIYPVFTPPLPNKPPSLPAIAPELLALHDVFRAANDALLGNSNQALRLVMASAALKVVAEEARKAIKVLRDQRT
jgi:sRNA-binding protein